MTEDPQKLFATRAEQFPQADDSDAARSVLEKTIEMVPVFGPATTWMLAQFWVPNLDRRRKSGSRNSPMTLTGIARN